MARRRRRLRLPLQRRPPTGCAARRIRFFNFGSHVAECGCTYTSQVYTRVCVFEYIKKPVCSSSFGRFFFPLLLRHLLLFIYFLYHGVRTLYIARAHTRTYIISPLRATYILYIYIRRNITASTNNSARAYRSALTDVSPAGMVIVSSSPSSWRIPPRYGSGFVFRAAAAHPSSRRKETRVHAATAHSHTCTRIIRTYIISVYIYITIIMVIITHKLGITYYACVLKYTIFERERRKN